MAKSNSYFLVNGNRLDSGSFCVDLFILSPQARLFATTSPPSAHTVNYQCEDEKSYYQLESLRLKTLNWARKANRLSSGLSAIKAIQGSLGVNDVMTTCYSIHPPIYGLHGQFSQGRSFKLSGSCFSLMAFLYSRIRSAISLLTTIQRGHKAMLKRGRGLSAAALPLAPPRPCAFLKSWSGAWNGDF